ncbi:MAG: cation diffusion facilitator family transporter [Kiritimatiellales bacterium]|nr:cation diffusion facilitator family transporter [Kiritimatiellales bacterium]
MGDPRKCKCCCPLMRMLINRVQDKESDADSTENRTRLGLLEGWVSTGVSILLCAVKGWLGLVSGSISMVADATNNLTDAGSSLVIALGFHWSRKPRDEKHPFGHGRIEAVATLVLSIALILVGFEVAKSGALRLIDPKPIESPLWLVVVTGVTVVVKLWLAVFARHLARMTRSHVLEADAWNHTFDVVCTLMVILALLSARFGWPAVDGWTALGVSLFILSTGIRYAREAIDILLGKQPEPAEVAAILESVVDVDGVLGTHEIMVHQYGDVKMVSFHIEVEAKQSVCAAHLISEQAEKAVEQSLGWRAVAHIDPVDRSHPLFDEFDRRLREYVATDKELVDFHDLRVTGSTEPFAASFDLVVCMETDKNSYDSIYKRTRKFIAGSFGERIASVEMGIETAVDSAPMERRLFDLK